MLRQAYRTMRSVPLLNAASTAAARALVDRTGRDATFFVDHLPRLGPVQVPLPNGRILRMHAERAEAYSNLVYWRGWDGPEPDSAVPFWELARRAGCVVDAGAHVGYYSLLASHANADAEVHAFEPLPHVAARFRRHCALNGATNVTLHEVGLADAPGRAVLHYSPDIPVPSASTMRSDVVGEANTAQVEVEVTTLDEVRRAGSWPRVDLFKLDTEGLEPAVLRGAATMLAEDRPVVLCEVLTDCDTADELMAVLSPLGYAYHLVLPGRLEQRDVIAPVPGLRNWVFAPADADLPGARAR